MGSGKNTHYEAVFFDLDDTLYDQAAPFAYAVEQVLGSLPRASAADLFETSRRYSQEIFQALRRDKAPTREMYIQRMKRTLAAYDIVIQDAQALELQHVYAAGSREAMRIDPNIQEALTWCYEHCSHGLGIITNGRGPQQLAKFNELGLERWVSAQHLFVSETLGVAKPSPEIFEIACHALEVDPRACLYVGDSFAIDVLGAHAVGMQAVWYNHRLRPTPQDQFPPEYEVHTPQELKQMLIRIV